MKIAGVVHSAGSIGQHMVATIDAYDPKPKFFQCFDSLFAVHVQLSLKPSLCKAFTR